MPKSANSNSPSYPDNWWNDFHHHFRAWRRNFKAAMPYVRRREYRILQEKHEQALQVLAAPSSPASDAALTVLCSTPLRQRELCMFVSFAPRPEVKAHVIHHIRALHAAGFDIALVINSDYPAEQFMLDQDLRSMCAMICVRQNIGFDFAAWSHLSTKLQKHHQTERILLVNDSIIGPLDPKNFDNLLQRIRNSTADVIGLTESQHPYRHLQSFFLIFQNRALDTGCFDRIMSSIQNLPTKEMVIEVYETRLTLSMKSQGMRCETLFSNMSNDKYSSNDTYFRWDQLIKLGFSYIKISLLAEKRHTPSLQAAIPKNLLSAWEKENS